MKLLSKNKKIQTIRKALGANRNVYSIMGVLIVLFTAFYLYRDSFVAASVNGRPITRIQVIRDLEKRAGEQALDSLITKTLINQKAKEEKIIISSNQISTELEKIKTSLLAQGQSFEQFLALQGYEEQDFVDELELRLKLEALLQNKIAITEEEIDKYIEDNSSFFTEEQTSKPNFRESIKDQLKNQKLSSQIQPFIEELRTTAKIEYF